MMRKSALVVFSGGQDSTTCLFWAKKHFEKVVALSFRYGQRHEQEVELARSIARDAEVEFHVLDVPLVGQLGANSLTDKTIHLDEVKPEGTFPNTFVPGRNLFFMSIAAVFAREHGIFDLVTGVSQTDYSGYPDCRDAFIKSLNVTLDLATRSACSTWCALARSLATTACSATDAVTARHAPCAAAVSKLISKRNRLQNKL